MDEPDLNAAMDRYACGDDRAFRSIHQALYPRLFAYLTRMTGSPALADDLAQETFLRVHRARATFARGGAALPWVYAIARNVHIDHTRAARHRHEERLPSDPGVAEPADAGDGDAENAAIASQMARTVERVLARLPAAQREAFVLLRYEGLSVQDAAGVLGATETAVKLRAFRAYEALRAELDLVQKPPEEKRAPSAHPAKPTGAGSRSTPGTTRASRATRATRSGGGHHGP